MATLVTNTRKELVEVVTKVEKDVPTGTFTLEGLTEIEVRALRALLGKSSNLSTYNLYKNLGGSSAQKDDNVKFNGQYACTVYDGNGRVL